MGWIRSIDAFVIAATCVAPAAALAGGFPTTAPTPLVLTVNAADPSEAGRQIGQQIGLRVNVTGDVGTIRFGGNKKPYVQAVTDFLVKAGLTFDNSTEFTLVRGTPLRVVPLGDAGALVVTRVSLTAQRAVATPQLPVYGYQIDAVLIADPALRILGVAQTTRVDRVDLPTLVSRDATPVFDAALALARVLSDTSAGHRVSMTFTSTAPAGRLPLIAGRLRAWQVADEAAVDVPFEQVADATPVQGRDVTAAVALDDAGGQSAGLRVTLTGPAAAAYHDIRWQQALRRSVTPLDIDGTPLPVDPFVRMVPNARPAAKPPDGVDIRLRPAGQPSAFFDQLTTIRIRIPTKVRVIDLPFEIRDLDLPGSTPAAAPATAPSN